MSSSRPPKLTPIASGLRVRKVERMFGHRHPAGFGPVANIAGPPMAKRSGAGEQERSPLPPLAPPGLGQPNRRKRSCDPLGLGD